MKYPKRIILLAIILSLGTALSVYSSITDDQFIDPRLNAKVAYEQYINDFISNCERLSELCCKSSGKNIRTEGDKKRAMGQYCTKNKSRLIDEMYKFNIDPSKEYKMRLFLIRSFHDYQNLKR
jgi:hypothetical protein